MFEMTEFQKEQFYNCSGYKYEDKKELSEFQTEYPYNNREWKYGPWLFSFQFNEESGDFICELYHRMTNHRVYGWRQDGSSISVLSCEEVYPDDV